MKNKMIPLLCTRGIIVFPNTETTLEVGRQISLSSIGKAMSDFDYQLIMTSQTDVGGDEILKMSDIYKCGTLVKIKNHPNGNAPGELKIVAIGLCRVKINQLHFKDGLVYAEYNELVDKITNPKEIEGLKRGIISKIQEGGKLSQTIPENVLVNISKEVSSSNLTDLIASFLPFSSEKKQQLLSEVNVGKRLKLLSSMLKEEQEINDIEDTLNKSMRKNLNNQQKEFILREKLKAIKAELGEISSKGTEIDDMISRANSGILPQYVQEKIMEEIKRYESMPPMAAEANVSKNFIEWVLKVPWVKVSKDATSLIRAKRILNKQHYGLEEIKTRIIEYLAVKNNTKSLTAPIICFVGPPGVGKTSLAKSIAQAMDRKFVKISLGGVRDEAEIRGHRRTYIGAMPGKIIKAITKSGVSNPLLLVDEIDKMASDYKGDPTSAMLEVLDPEQNSAFQDHYLEFEYDLSKVIFVATANYFQNIPEPLLDRMEVIELNSYTDNEKANIAKKHLIPKVIKNNGLLASEFELNDESIKFIINRYTLESGVRNLIRALDKIARKLVVKKLKNKLSTKNVVDIEQIKSLLGTPIYDHDKKAEKPQIGAITALAYTQYGGTTLAIEATKVPGRGELKLTGQLKDVMSESANIALTYVKANAKKFGIKTNFSKFDIHIHAAAGAIPKDGPSAGITFTTAIISMLKKQPVSQNVAMTGEITLRGHVLPIGGLKEKSLAAMRMGIRTIFIPEQNKKNLKDFKSEIKQKIKYYPVKKLYGYL